MNCNYISVKRNSIAIWLLCSCCIILENDKIGIEKNFAKWFEDLNLNSALEGSMEDIEIPTTSSADIFAFS